MVLAALAAVLATACAATSASLPSADAPYALVLGTAQDAGLPQIACTRPCCEAARRDPRRARRVSALLVVDPRSDRRWLFDATPDLAEQVEAARVHPPGHRVSAGRPPLFDAIFLTHAHLGHYAGLLQLGREAYAADHQPVYATPRFERFLRTNGPWSLLVESGALELRPLAPGAPVVLAPDLSVTALAVPHRDEFSDTVAYLVRGPTHALLYLPDIDKWERWERPLEDVLASVDTALLDGSFFAPGELGDRDLSAVPHPFIVETLARLAPLPAAERAKVHFTHLNHSNPAADPASAARAEIRTLGADVAFDGQRFEL